MGEKLESRCDFQSLGRPKCIRLIASVEERNADKLQVNDSFDTINRINGQNGNEIRKQMKIRTNKLGQVVKKRRQISNNLNVHVCTYPQYNLRWPLAEMRKFYYFVQENSDRFNVELVTNYTSKIPKLR